MVLAGVSISELRDIPLFHALKKQHLAALADIALRIKYDPRMIVLNAGTIPKRIGIIRRGSMTRLFSLDNHLIPIEHLHSGSLWGDDALIQPSARASAMLRTEQHGAESIEIPIFQLLGLFEKFPELGATVAHALLKLQSAQKMHNEDTLSCLYGINHILQGAGTPADKCAAALRLAADTLGARGAFLARFDTTARRILMLTHLGTPSLTGRSYSLLADTLLAMVYTTRTSHIIGKRNAERKFMKMEYFKPSMALAPLIAHTDVIGVIAITDATGHDGFTTHESELLNVIGGMLVPLLLAMEHQDMTTHNQYLKRTYIDTTPRLV